MHCRHWKVEGVTCQDCGLEMVRGLRISIDEVRRTAEYLRDQGWSGFLPFDHAVRALDLRREKTQVREKQVQIGERIEP